MNDEWAALISTAQAGRRRWEAESAPLLLGVLVDHLMSCYRIFPAVPPEHHLEDGSLQPSARIDHQSILSTHLPKHHSSANPPAEVTTIQFARFHSRATRLGIPHPPSPSSSRQPKPPSLTGNGLPGIDFFLHHTVSLSSQARIQDG